MSKHTRCLNCMEANDNVQVCPHCGLPEGAAPESTLHLPPGTMLQGKYLLGRALGQGGFGITYLAWDTNLNQKLAIKEYLPQQLAYRTGEDLAVSFYKSSSAEEFKYGLDRFLEEAQTLARFNEHPNIVTVHDYCEANNTAYLVMNYLEGVTLQSYLENKGGKISVEQALSIFMPVLDALKEVHAAGILHRDISPDNLLIDKNGRVILIDFGAARQAMGEKSKSLSVIMKAGYSPVEQYYSKGKQGPWTDIYAVAASLYRAIIGRAPAEAFNRVMEDNMEPPSALGIKINVQFEEALLKALAVKAEKRYQTVEEFQVELLKSGQNCKAKEAVAIPSVGKLINIKSDSKIPPSRLTNLNKNRLIHGTKGGEGRSILLPVIKKYSTVFAIALIISSFLFFAGYKFIYDEKKDKALASLDSEALGREVVKTNTEDTGWEKIIPEDSEEAMVKYFDPEVIAALDADYYIDYKNGTIPIGELPIGTRVVDPFWEWEFRTGNSYLGNGIQKPVNWLIVANNHYENLAPHVTLLSEEVIGRKNFSAENNHWGDSSLRDWLNNDRFIQAFSSNFTNAILITVLINKEWERGLKYTTEDRIFLPSTTELGDINHRFTYQIGTVYTYFHGADKIDRIAIIGGEDCWYWTRSPYNDGSSGVRTVDYDGDFSGFTIDFLGIYGVRPALNLKSDTLVSEIRR